MLVVVPVVVLVVGVEEANTLEEEEGLGLLNLQPQGQIVVEGANSLEEEEGLGLQNPQPQG